MDEMLNLELRPWFILWMGISVMFLENNTEMFWLFYFLGGSKKHVEDHMTWVVDGAICMMY